MVTMQKALDAFAAFAANDVIAAMPNGHTRPVSPERLAEIKNSISAKNVTIRMRNEDVRAAKEKAARVGMPYQTLLNTIIHRYFNGGIILKEPV